MWLNQLPCLLKLYRESHLGSETGLILRNTTMIVKSGRDLGRGPRAVWNLERKPLNIFCVWGHTGTSCRKVYNCASTTLMYAILHAFFGWWALIHECMNIALLCIYEHEISLVAVYTKRVCCILICRCIGIICVYVSNHLSIDDGKFRFTFL